MLKLIARGIFAFLCIIPAALVAAQGTPGREQSRGELLYSTHCIACHTTQVHWRDQRLAMDWNGLTGQVRRWMSNAGLPPNDEDAIAIAQYLNRLYYHFPAGKGDRSISLRKQD